MAVSPVKQPSAWIPITMSLGALAMTLSYVSIVGVTAAHQPDEGAVAHIFQLLMAGQVPIIGYFAFTWLPRAPKQAMQVLALQLGAVIAALAPVYLLGL